MRNVFLALLATLVLLLSACDTSTPNLKDDTCDTSTSADCTDGDNNNNGGDNGGTNGGDPNGGGTNGGGTTPTPTPAPVYDPSLMKGFVTGYKGDKVLTVKSLWIDQSNGQIVDLGTDPNARLELSGEFGVRLGTPADAALATLPLPITCGTLTTTTVPAGLSSAQGALVPALFVFDGNQLVGLILHGSYHVENGKIVPKAKLAMRVYSAAEKIIAKGECSETIATDALAANTQNMIDALTNLGVNSPEINDLLGELATISTPTLTAKLTVDVGLKKGWNTVVLGAEADVATGELHVTLADDTQPNFTWYYLDLTQFIK